MATLKGTHLSECPDSSGGAMTGYEQAATAAKPCSLGESQKMPKIKRIKKAKKNAKKINDDKLSSSPPTHGFSMQAGRS